MELSLIDIGFINYKGSIIASTPQILAIALTFLCDHFINHYEDKKWIIVWRGKEKLLSLPLLKP